MKAALRAICAGEVTRDDSNGDDTDSGHRVVDLRVSVGSEPPLGPLCPHKEWAEDGEQYQCRLQSGHKGKCVPGERVIA
jgi:hypothetical protein